MRDEINTNARVAMMGYLLQEVMSEHSDPGSPIYNQCDSAPCGFCIRAKYLVAEDPAQYCGGHVYGWADPMRALSLLVYELENTGRYTAPHPDLGVPLVLAVKPLVLYWELNKRRWESQGVDKK